MNASLGHVANLFSRHAAGSRLATFQLNLQLADVRDISPSSSPLRQVLLVENSDLEQLRAAPGALGENITVRLPGLMQLESGLVLQVGTAALRLTFHCEPCYKVAHLAARKKLVARRGYLAQIERPGVASIGDEILAVGQLAPIPHDVPGRISWYLRQVAEVSIAELVDAVGLPRSSARAVPGYLRRLADADLGMRVVRADGSRVLLGGSRPPPE
jgi:hypothetical protein